MTRTERIADLVRELDGGLQCISLRVHLLRDGHDGPDPGRGLATELLPEAAVVEHHHVHPGFLVRLLCYAVFLLSLLMSLFPLKDRH